MKISQIVFAAAAATAALPAFAAVPGSPDAAVEIASQYMVRFEGAQPENIRYRFVPGEGHTATVELVNSQPDAKVPSCAMSMTKNPNAYNGAGWEITNPNCVLRPNTRG